MSDTLWLPVSGGKFVSILISDLPNDPTHIISQVLISEAVPLKKWLETAIVYFKKGNHDAFFKILTTLTTDTPREMQAKINEDRATMVTIYHTLAAYYTRQMRTATDKFKVNEYHKLANMYFNNSVEYERSASLNDGFTHAGKGINLLFGRKSGDADADKKFNFALEQNPRCIPALLGKGCILYMKKKYQEALDKFKQVLTIHPNCHPSVRLAMAYCYNKLGKNELAKLALQRVIDLNPDVETLVEALANLAIFYFSESNDEKAQDLVVRAYNYDTSNSKVLNLLSRIYFQTDDQKCEVVATRAYTNTNIPKLQAESKYYLGRLAQDSGDFQSAMVHFEKAHIIADSPLLQFSRGQMLLHQSKSPEDMDVAKHCFKKVLQEVPENCENLRVLAHIYSETGRKEKAAELLKKAVASKPDNYDANLELAQLLETSDYQAAVKGYEKVVALIGNDSKVPKEIWNNMGVLHHQFKRFPEAEQYYRKALVGEVPQDEYEERLYGTSDVKAADGKRMRWNIENVLQTHSNVLYSPDNITVTYNLARLYEEDLNWEVATQLYKGILAEHPNYVDCCMRLGMMCKSKGEILKASEWYRDAMTSTARRCEAWTCVGNLHLEKAEWSQAQKKYEEVLKNTRTDPYVSLQFANIFLSSAKLYPEKKAKYLGVAQDYCFSVLRRDPTNIYAANGLAIVFTELGHFDDAKEFFMQVREATSSIPDIWINIANLNLIQKQYENAIRLYKTCLRDFYNNSDPNVLLYLAKAYFEDGQFEECKRTIQKAIRIHPWNLDLWFNLALTLKENALRLSDKDATVAKTEQAILHYKAAIPIYGHLLEVTAPSDSARPVRRNFSTSKCGQHSTLCVGNLDVSSANLKILIEKEQQRSIELEEKRAKAERIVQERMRKKEEELRQQERESSKYEAEAQNLIQLALSSRGKSVQGTAIDDTPRKRTKKKKSGEEQGEGGEKKRKRKKSTKKGGERKKRKLKKKGEAEQEYLNEVDNLLGGDVGEGELLAGAEIEGGEPVEGEMEIQQEVEGEMDPEVDGEIQEQVEGGDGEEAAQVEDLLTGAEEEDH